ncbi:MAG: pilin [Planctomycetes bacterium]|jgi:hypothetical protein|nr:pilin [Planctomycetota bacterium]
MKKIFNFVKKTSLLLGVLFFLFLGISPVLAQSKDGDYGLAETVGEGQIQGAMKTKNVDSGAWGFVTSELGRIIGYALSFVGVIFLVLMIYGGILWMTAQGNEEQTKKAKTLIVDAVIGLVIVMSAYAITAFVGQALTE